MTTSLTRLDDGSLELTLTIPWPDVKSVYDHVVSEMTNAAQVAGFRKGKAPKKLVEDKLDKSKVYEEVLKELIPKAYNDAIASQKIRPVINPKVELKQAKEGSDWIIRMLTCERPNVVLGDYKKEIAELKAAKHKKIWVPGSDAKPQQPDQQGQGDLPAGGQEPDDKKPTLDELLGAFLKHVTVMIPALLAEHEVNRLLSELIDQTKRLGLTVEQYLSSTGRTAESVRKEYENQASRTLSLEFALEEVADKEGILVSDDDIEAVIKTGKTDEEKKALERDRYYLASVLRRQKTLDFLASL